MAGFTPVASTVGGLLLGGSSAALLYFNGRIAGISGIAGGVAAPSRDERDWRLAFLAGLVAGGGVLRVVRPASFEGFDHASLPLLAAAGALVGFGARLANGCTSGHGVVGLARRSPRSLVATVTFMAVALAVVFVARHVVGP